MTEKARRCIEWVIAREGGYVCHPNDPGGETNYGISKRAHPDLDIANLTAEDAAKVYERDYWQAIEGDRWPEPLALALLDYAVHSGAKRARRELAVLIGLPRDSEIGEIVEAVRTVPDPGVVAVQLVIERAIFLVRRALSVPGQDVFAAGWIRRVVELKRAVEAAPKGG